MSCVGMARKTLVLIVVEIEGRLMEIRVVSSELEALYISLGKANARATQTFEATL